MKLECYTCWFVWNGSEVVQSGPVKELSDRAVWSPVIFNLHACSGTETYKLKVEADRWMMDGWLKSWLNYGWIMNVG